MERTAAGKAAQSSPEIIPLIRRTVSPLNGESPLTALRRDVTRTDEFFVRSHAEVPEIDARSWRLTVEDSKGTARFSYSKLEGMRQQEVSAVIECAGNGRSGFGQVKDGEVAWEEGAVGNARWSGVFLKEIVDLSSLRMQDMEVRFSGADFTTLENGERRYFVRSLSVADARRALVALRMNGEKLTPEHGKPARLIVPGWYGMASVKWLDTITVSSVPYEGFYQSTKYVYEQNGVVEPVTRMRVNSVITSPLHGEAVELGRRLTVSGKAWTGNGEVRSVEVHNGREWIRAEIGERNGAHEWVSWSATVVPSALGVMGIQARATDGRETQGAYGVENRYQYGFNGMHRIRVNVIDPAVGAMLGL